MSFDDAFQSSVTVYNRAVSGASTKSFINAGRWSKVTAELKEGDYVFINFGHNDEEQTKSNSTTPSEYTANLTKMVRETLAKKAIPVLLTSITRYKWSNGSVKDSHPYSKYVREVATAQKAHFIDLNTLSKKLLESYGQEPAKKLYLFFKGGLYPAYPDGASDETHLSVLGASEMSDIVESELKRQNIPLGTRLK